MVEADIEAGKVPRVFVPHPANQGFRGDAFLFRTQHDRRAMGVVGAHVAAIVPLHFLEAHPDIGLDVFNQMAEVDAAIGVGQGGGDKDLAGHGQQGKPGGHKNPTFYRLEARAGLFQELKFVIRGGSTQDGVAMRKAPEARHHVAMFARIVQETIEQDALVLSSLKRQFFKQ